MARFSDALDRNMEEIVRPPVPPVGHYVMRVTKMPDPATEMTGKDGTPYEKITIPVAIVSAHEDVDEDMLAEYGNPAGYNLRIDFIFNVADGEENKFEQTLHNLKTFLKNLGLDVESGTLKEALASAANCQFLGELKHRMNPNDQAQVFAEVGRTSAL